MDDLCSSISSGRSKSREVEGTYPVYGSTGIIARTDEAQYFKDNVLIARVGANAGFVQIATGQYDVSDNTLVVDVKPEFSLKYVFYLLENIGLNKYAKGGGQPLITAGEIKQIDVYIPTKERQESVVSTLDKFDALCTDISEGLPAEINARQKQYEYYRDKLLTFKEIEKVE